MLLRSQASSEQADAQKRAQVSREMLPILDMPIHCHAWVYIICLEIPAKNCRWKEISFYRITDREATNITKINKYKKLTYKVSKNKHATDEDKNNQIHSQIKIHSKYLKNINKIEKYKKTVVYRNTWLGNTIHFCYLTNMFKIGHVEKTVDNTLMLIKFSKKIANSFAKITNAWRFLFLEVIRGKFKILPDIWGGAFSAMS